MKNIIRYLITLSIFLSSMLSLSNDFPQTIKATAIAGSQYTILSQIVMEKVYDQLGINLQVIEVPGKTSLELSNSGTADAELFRIDGMDKKFTNLIKVPIAINELNGIVFALNDDIKIESWESLRGYKIGIQHGIQFTANGTKGMSPLVVDTIDQMFKMLESGRLDVIVVAELNAKKILANFKSDKIIELKPVIQNYPLYHYLHKDHENLYDPILKVLIKMQEKGEFKKIRQEYIQSFSNE